MKSKSYKVHTLLVDCINFRPISNIREQNRHLHHCNHSHTDCSTTFIVITDLNSIKTLLTKLESTSINYCSKYQLLSQPQSKYDDNDQDIMTKPMHCTWFCIHLSKRYHISENQIWTSQKHTDAATHRRRHNSKLLNNKWRTRVTLKCDSCVNTSLNGTLSFIIWCNAYL